MAHFILITWDELIKLFISSATRVVILYMPELLPQQMCHAFPVSLTIYL